MACLRNSQCASTYLWEIHARKRELILKLQRMLQNRPASPDPCRCHPSQRYVTKPRVTYNTRWNDSEFKHLLMISLSSFVLHDAILRPPLSTLPPCATQLCNILVERRGHGNDLLSHPGFKVSSPELRQWNRQQIGGLRLSPLQRNNRVSEGLGTLFFRADCWSPALVVTRPPLYTCSALMFFRPVGNLGEIERYQKRTKNVWR